MANDGDVQIDRSIQSNLDKLKKSGVLTVRPGYEIAGGQLTGKRAVVATVRAKKPLYQLAEGEALPDTIDGTAVDVREASPYQRLRSVDPLAAEISHTYRRPEDDEPTWPLEREMPSGALLSSAGSGTRKKLKSQLATHASGEAALARHAKKAFLKYAPKGCPLLEPMTVTGAITVAVSPDAGLATLTKFLAGTVSNLKVGMYDFTSATILAEFEEDLRDSKDLQMVLDNPAPNPTLDQSDWDTVKDLKSALSGRAKIARALTRSDAFASVWSFPYAYHIKLIVQDGGAFWLSSGNLNDSNEPVLSHPPSAMDRDWHVIIADERLAGIFGAYLDFDYTNALEHQADNPNEIEQAIEAAHQKKQREANAPGQPAFHSRKPPKPTIVTRAAPVAAKTFPRISLSVTPLLTPDTLSDGETGQYLHNVMNLIGGARKSIYLQLQYIEASKDDSSPYGKLLRAIAGKIAAKVDVRLIVHESYAQKWGEKMIDEGVNLTANIRTQPNVHNKGFVVDSKTVVVSSQNFSPAGVSQNRDAGLILESPEIARYFEPIFLADWERSVPLRVRASAGVARSATKKGGARAAPQKTGAVKKSAAKKAPTRKASAHKMFGKKVTTKKRGGKR